MVSNMRVTIYVDPADAKSWDDICHDIAIGVVNRVEIRGTGFDKVVRCSKCIHHKSTDVYDYCNLIRLPINLDDFCSRGSTSSDIIPESLSIDE